MSSHSHCPCRAASRQRGVVILTFILIVLSATSFVVLKALNESAAHQSHRSFQSTRVLNEAKRALIGYAVAYADGTHALEKGPGHLPCPDHSTAGTPGSSDAVPDCTAAGNNETGHFPWRTLGLSELLDGTGSPLWYAVSDNYRSTASPPLNSDTAGTLSVDATGDVVAVLIAPGEALSGQARTVANRYDSTVFLEGENASAGDGVFTTVAAGDFNDVVVYITRAELMRAVEKTVVTEVANALDNYFADPDGDELPSGDDPDFGSEPECADAACDGYPWLSPFAPAATAFPGVVGTTFGRVPYVEAGVPFPASFLAAWDIASDGAITTDGDEPPAESCVRSNVCTQSFTTSGWLMELLEGILSLLIGFLIENDESFGGNVTGAPGGGWSQGTCTLAGPDSITCSATYDFEAGFSLLGLPLVIPGTTPAPMRRSYQLTFSSNTRMWPPTAIAPGPGRRRTVGVQQADDWPGAAEAVITVTDFDVQPSVTERGSSTLSFSTLSAGDTVSLTAVPFDLELSADAAIDHATSPGELPNWFAANGWDRLVLVRYSDADRPGDTFATCAAGGSCLTVNVAHPGAVATADPGISGIVFAAGADITAGADRDGDVIAGYLEGDNNDGDDAFDHQQVSAGFNDTLVMLPLLRP